MKWTVFDFEFTELLPEIGLPWPSNLHIACASIYSLGETWPQVWYERFDHDENSDPGDFMSETTLRSFVFTLLQKVQEGFTLVTWGGASSDWRLLARECPSLESLIRELALNSIDIPMCSCMSIGVMMGLNSACKAIGIDLKDSDASAKVPEQWKAGVHQRHNVLQHVSNDSYATMLVLSHTITNGYLAWITQKGQLKTWNNVRFMTVRECLQKELPNVPFPIRPTQNAKLMARWLLFEHS